MAQLPSLSGQRVRSGSPASQPENDSVHLTPRSKVRALLAELDDSDDDAEEIRSKEIPSPATLRTQISKGQQSNPTGGNISENEEDTIIAPKGRLAARLQAQTERPTSHVSLSHAEGNIPYYGGEEEDTDENQNKSPVTPRLLGRFSKETHTASIEGNGVDSLELAEVPASTAASSDSEAERFSTQENITLPKPISSGGNASTAKNKNDRFNALVEKKRAERVAREAAEDAKRAENKAMRRKTTANDELCEVDSDDDDSECGIRLTQRTRPTRKAGKKAIEEMARETQRISRNMQLSHEAKTKKKVTKESLLARFRAQVKPSPVSVLANSSTGNSSTANSDAEDQGTTPQTSPERQPRSKLTNIPDMIPETSNLRDVSDDELPSTETTVEQSIDKRKATAPEISVREQHFPTPADSVTLPEQLPHDTVTHRKELKHQLIRVLFPSGPSKRGDSDGELEIVQSKAFRVFDNLPKKQRSNERSLLRLRALAGLTSPSRKSNVSDKPSITPQELAAVLKTKARRQAAAERSEKIEILRSKGVIIQTAEERQRDQMEVEDMLEKARQEVEELTRKEKDDAKRAAKANGEEIEDSSGDEEYQDHEDGEDVELSGSEDEDSGDEGEEEKSGAEMDDGLVDDAASESEAIEEEGKDENDREGSERGEFGSLENQTMDDDDDDGLFPQTGRRRNARRVVDDDDEVNEIEKTHVNTVSTLPSTLPAQITDAVLNPFGPQIGLADAPMGLTQAFAATMADSQFHEGSYLEGSLAQLRSMPSPDFPNLVPESIRAETQSGTMVELDIDLHITQTQIEHDTLPKIADATFTQLSDIPDPTQDAGFERSSPMPTRFAAAPLSTIDTIIIPRESIPTGISQRRRRLNRGQRAIAVFSDDEDSDEGHHSDDTFDEESNNFDETAFDVMRQAAEKSKRNERKFDKGKSEAKEMFEEQAQESEDEYAGLGGASDDSEGEEDEEIREMMDESEVNVNERKIAAYFAEKERQENEAGVNKLFKDINSGALRRKRGAGADFDDLDDSDDEHQARQARKRREFARMRNALFESDSNIVKIAEDPKKLAFLRAIEDRDETDEVGILESTPREDANSMNSQDVIPDSQSENRPPGDQGRRVLKDGTLIVKHNSHLEARQGLFGPARKPATLADIRASVSFLVEEPDSMITTMVGPSIFDASSDLEMEDEDVEAEQDLIGEPDAPPDAPQYMNPRRTRPGSTSSQFVDRLSLKRIESSKDSQGSGRNLAFVDPRFSSDAMSFKPPTLLRKATSSFSTLSGQDENGISLNNNAKKATVEPEVKGRGVGGGSKRSSVNYYARAAERKAALERKLGRHQTSASDITSLRRHNSGLSSVLGSANAWE